MILIEIATCIMCQQCILSCPEEALKSVNLRPHLDQSKCTECKICLFYCPAQAIKETKK